MAGPINPDTIELPERRTRGSKHFASTKVARSYTTVFGGEMHYRNGVAWRDIDLAFRPDSSGFVSDANHTITRLYRTAGRNYLEAAERDTGRGVRFVLPGASLPAPSGGGVRVDRDGLSWSYEVTKRGLKLSARVARALGPRSYSFVAEPVGGAPPLVANEDGSLSSGDLFALPRPFAVDARGLAYPVGSWRIGAGGAITFDFDDTNVPTPYAIDPTTTFSVAASADDAYAEKAASAVWLPNTATALNTTLNVVYTGKSLVTYYYLETGMFRWDTSSIPDTDSVTAATFRVVPAAISNLNSLSWLGDWYTGAFDATAYVVDVAGSAFGAKPLSGLALNVANDVALLNPGANVNKGGYTQLRTGLTPGATPTGNNNVQIAAWDHATLAEPQLIVDHKRALRPAIGVIGGL